MDDTTRVTDTSADQAVRVPSRPIPRTNDHIKCRHTRRRDIDGDDIDDQ